MPIFHSQHHHVGIVDGRDALVESPTGFDQVGKIMPSLFGAVKEYDTGPSPKADKDAQERQDIQNLRLENEVLERRLLTYEERSASSNVWNSLTHPFHFPQKRN